MSFFPQAKEIEGSWAIKVRESIWAPSVRGGACVSASCRTKAEGQLSLETDGPSSFTGSFRKDVGVGIRIHLAMLSGVGGGIPSIVRALG